MSEAKFKYSEIFKSIQGEGHYTGVPTMWIRWFLCNLQCSGFGQKDPADESTWELPYKEFDATQVKRIEDLPVWDKGCDSSYSWAKKFKHLCPSGTAAEIADELEDHLATEHNPYKKFTVVKAYEMTDPDDPTSEGYQKHSVQDTHLCMTGGEPMMKQSQVATMAVLKELESRNNLPRYVTIETNGTQELTPEMRTMITNFGRGGPHSIFRSGEWFWSVSPKLLHTSGEPAERAIKPEIVRSYADVSPYGQLKFVVSGTKESWDELEQRVHDFRMAGVMWPVWIMPVGATVEEQSTDTVGEIANEAIERGYNVSARVHCYLWGNKIGT